MILQSPPQSNWAFFLNPEGISSDDEWQVTCSSWFIVQNNKPWLARCWRQCPSKSDHFESYISHQATLTAAALWTWSGSCCRLSAHQKNKASGDTVQLSEKRRWPPFMKSSSRKAGATGHKWNLDGLEINRWGRGRGARLDGHTSPRRRFG